MMNSPTFPVKYVFIFYKNTATFYLKDFGYILIF